MMLLRMCVAQPFLGAIASSDADDRDAEPATACQVVQRREDLLVGEISGDPEDDDRRRRRLWGDELGQLTRHLTPHSFPRGGHALIDLSTLVGGRTLPFPQNGGCSLRSLLLLSAR